MKAVLVSVQFDGFQYSHGVGWRESLCFLEGTAEEEGTVGTRDHEHKTPVQEKRGQGPGLIGLVSHCAWRSWERHCTYNYRQYIRRKTAFKIASTTVPSIAATLREQHFRGGLYWGVVLYTNCSFVTWVPGCYIAVAFIQGWPLRGVPLYYRYM